MSSPLDVTNFGRIIQNSIFASKLTYNPSQSATDKNLTIQLEDQTNSGSIRMYANTNHGIDIQGGLGNVGIVSAGNLVQSATGNHALTIRGTTTETHTGASTLSHYGAFTRSIAGLTNLTYSSNVNELVTGSHTLSTSGNMYMHSTGTMDLTTLGLSGLNITTNTGNLNVVSNNGNITVGSGMTNNQSITIGTFGAGTLVLQANTVHVSSGGSVGAATFENVRITGNLSVEGVTTYVNTSSLVIEDKNIQLAHTNGEKVVEFVQDAGSTALTFIVTSDTHEFNVSDWILLQNVHASVDGVRQVIATHAQTFAIALTPGISGASGLNAQAGLVQTEANINGAGIDIVAQDAGTLSTRFMRYDNTGKSFDFGVDNDINTTSKVLNINLTNNTSSYNISGTKLLAASSLNNMSGGIYLDDQIGTTVDNKYRLRVLYSGTETAAFVVQQYDTSAPTGGPESDGWLTRFEVSKVV